MNCTQCGQEMMLYCPCGCKLETPFDRCTTCQPEAAKKRQTVIGARVCLTYMETQMKGTCQDCNGTGVIDTGNNDLPCSCPAGDRAIFNVSGEHGPLTGQELRTRSGR